MKIAYVLAALTTGLTVNALYIPKPSNGKNDKSPHPKPVIEESIPLISGSNPFPAQGTTINMPPTLEEQQPVSAGDDKSNPSGEYWRNLYDQRLRVIIDAGIKIPLTLRMDWSTLTYRDKAEKLYELVAFAGSSELGLERDFEGEEGVRQE